MKSYVTGGSGFVGRNLIAYLRGRGHEVRALARSDAAVAAVEKAGAIAVRGDLEDPKGLAGCEVVFHSAAKVEDWGPRADFQRANVDGTQRLCGAARAAGVRRLVHVSTEAVLLGGKPIHGADESWPLPARPLGMYPWSKGLAEGIVREANRDGLETIIVRPRFVWGEGDTTLLPKLVDMIKSGKFAWIAGGRVQTSTCHVENLCAALLLAAEKSKPGETYFVTDGPPVEIRDFWTRLFATQGVVPKAPSIPHWAAAAAAWVLEGVFQLLGLRGPPPITRMAVKLVGEDVTVDDSKIRRELGFVPPVTREAGLARMSHR